MIKTFFSFTFFFTLLLMNSIAVAQNDLTINNDQIWITGAPDVGAIFETTDPFGEAFLFLKAPTNQVSMVQWGSSAAGTFSDGTPYAGTTELNTFNSSRFIIGTDMNAPIQMMNNGQTVMSVRDGGVGIGTGLNPLSFPFHLRHGLQGFLMEENLSGMNNNWELRVEDTGEFNLYANGILRGTFSPIDGTYTSSSDARFKTDIQTMNSVLSNVMQLKPAKYTYIDNNPEQLQSLGFIAQEVKPIFPELVHEHTSQDNLQTVNYSGFSVIAIKAIQEQQALITQLSTENQELKNAVKTLAENQEKILQQLEK